MTGTLWRVERKRGSVWVLSASFTVPKNSSEEFVLKEFRRRFPLMGEGEFRAAVAR